MHGFAPSPGTYLYSSIYSEAFFFFWLNRHLDTNMEERRDEAIRKDGTCFLGTRLMD